MGSWNQYIAWISIGLYISFYIIYIYAYIFTYDDKMYVYIYIYIDMHTLDISKYCEDYRDYNLGLAPVYGT